MTFALIQWAEFVVLILTTGNPNKKGSPLIVGETK